MEYKIDDIIGSHFNPGIVTASYFASLCGCLLTVELLHRRGTGVYNWRSWLETFACATCLGLIGIWCMHFIGNRAIILGDGKSKIQLVYSPGYSTLSVFLPIIGLSIAFSAAEYPSRSKMLHWMALTCTGVFAGLSIVGMHYIGNFGISNYTLKYEHRFLSASIVIAIGDCLAVLILFYTWRETWISRWWKRLLCAMCLAGGVSAMHFTASTNCIYRLKAFNGPAAIRSRNIQVIVAGVLCGTAAIIVFCVLFFTRHRARVLKRNSQKVMLACAMFDPDDRILVTTEGVLPAKEITDKFNHRTFDEEFDTSHPAFQWIFRVTRNWSVVTELIPKMKSHLSSRKGDDEEDSRPSSSASSTLYDPESYKDYSIIFRERFCTAAAALAASMQLSIENIGVLYDRIVETGTLKWEDRVGKRNTLISDMRFGDIEMGVPSDLFGKGQLLFLTRRLTAEDVDKLLNAGFKFASIQQVGRNIAETMQIPLTALELHISGLKNYVDKLSTLEKYGTWLSFFAIIPKPNCKGFDVGVKKNDQDQLPDVKLLPSEPLSWQSAFLQRMDDKSTGNCMAFLEDRQRKDPSRTPQEQQFALDLLQAIIQLSQQVPGQWFQNARFSSKPVYAHYSQTIRPRAHVTLLYAFVVCADLHTSIESSRSVTRVPLSFFRARQQCYAGSPNHVVLAQDIHQEFGPLLSRNTVKRGGRKMKKISAHMLNASNKKLTDPSSRRPSTAQNSDGQTDRSSEALELVDNPQHPSELSQDTVAGAERGNAWGGILVNSETVVKSDSKSEFSTDGPTTGHGMGMRVAVGLWTAENTFVDDLLAATRVTIQSKIGA